MTVRRVKGGRCLNSVRLLTPVAVALATLMLSCGDSNSSEESSPPESITSVVGDLTPFAASDAVHRVRDLLVENDSLVWVLTGVEPFVHKYSVTGRFFESYGRAGDGPREMRNPFAMVLAVDGGGVDIWDVGNTRMLRLSGEGQVVQSEEFLPPHRGVTRGDLEEITYFRPYQLKMLDGRYVIASFRGNISGDKDLLHAAIVKNVGSSRFDTLFDLEDRLNRDTIAQRAERLLALPLWTVCRGSLVVLDPGSHSVVTVYGDHHESLASLPEKARELTDTDIRRYLWHVMGLEIGGPTTAEDTLRLTQAANEILSSARYLFPPTVPPAVSLKCGSNGEVWLQQFDNSENPLGFGRTWWKLGSSRPLEVDFPSGFQPYVFLDSMAVGVHTDELDVERIASAPLP